jgi:hypothetical protein
MGSYQQSSSSSKESPLTKTQNKILQKRESLFESWYLPEVKETMAQFNPDSKSGAAAFNLNAKQINSSFDSEQKQTGQMLAQQNLLGSGAGAALTARGNRARASALADAYNNQMATSNSNKASLLSTMSTLMPSTSTAAPILNSSSSSGVQLG